MRRPGEDLAEITSRLTSDLPAAAPVPRFSSVTEEAGLGDFVTFRGERTSELPEDMGAGAAWGDFDNDGDDDLFLVGAGGGMSAPPESWAESALYENRGDGTFRRVTALPEVRLLGMAAAWGDVNGDGWQDLVVTGYDAIVLLRNHEGRFERDDGLNRPGYWGGAACGDFDKDRELDTLYVDQLAFSTASTASGSVHKAFAEVPIIGSASGHGSCCEASTGGFDDHHDEGDHEESGMHVLPLEVETSPPAESLAGGGEHASSLPESDPLALWCAAAATLT